MADLPPPPPPSDQPPPQGGWQQQPPQQGGWQQPPQQGGWQQPPQQGGWQPPQQVVVKQGSGCLKAALIVFGVLVVLGVLAVGFLVFAGNEVVKEIGKSMGTAASSDYAISEVQCVPDGTLGLDATGKIKNLSKKAQGFQVTVRWETDEGDLISVDSTFTDTIKVGQSQAWKTTSFEDVPAGATPKCEVSKVEYTIFDDEGD